MQWSELRTRLRTDVLRDTGSTQKWSDAQLLRFANDALMQLFPFVFVYGADETTQTTFTTEADGRVHGVTRYSLPALVPTYPQACPVYQVQIGPIGGEKVTGSARGTDRFGLLRGRMGLNEAWEIDWGARKLVLKEEPPYDAGGVYRWYIRMLYVYPIPLLTSDTSVLLAPDNVIPLIEHWVQFVAMRNLFRSALTDSERLSNMGASARTGAEAFRASLQRGGVRMSWPKVLR